MMLLPRDDEFLFYRYSPSLVAAILFIGLFGLTTILHAYQMIRTTTWFFMPFVLGGLNEVMGYCFRAVSASQPTNQWTMFPYMAQSVLILIAPALFTASMYTELGHIVELCEGDDFLPIRRRLLTIILASGNALSLLVLGSGGGMMGLSNKDTRKLGERVAVGGLALQVIFIGVFMWAASTFHRKLRRQPTQRSSEVPWQRHMVALYLTSILILVRGEVRAVELLQVFHAFLQRSEVYFYALDSALMFVVMVIMNWIHPSQIKSLLKGGKAATGFKLVTV